MSVHWFIIKVNLLLSLINESSHHEDILENGGIALCIVDLGTGWIQEAGWTPKLVRMLWRRDKSLAFAGNET
jgi:hypothetical protein